LVVQDVWVLVVGHLLGVQDVWVLVVGHLLGVLVLRDHQDVWVVSALLGVLLGVVSALLGVVSALLDLDLLDLDLLRPARQQVATEMLSSSLH
jgi:hypothetical protein